MRLRYAALSLALAAGCAAAPPPTPQAKLEVIRREQTADKLFERGLAFAEIGDLTRAEQYLAAALDQGAPPRRTLAALLRVCVAAGRNRAAIVYAREYGSALSGDAQFDFILALLESGVGDVEAAIEHLRQTVRRAPEHADAHYRLGELLQQRELAQDESLFHLREYLRLAPNGSHADAARSALKDTDEQP